MSNDDGSPLSYEEIEAEVELAKAEAGFHDPIKIVGALDAARRVPNFRIEPADGLNGDAFSYQLANGVWVAQVCQWLPVRAFVHKVSHELGEVRYAVRGLVRWLGRYIEQASNRFGAAWQAGAKAILHRIKMWGGDVELYELAKVFEVSQTVMGLRLGETGEYGSAIIRSGEVWRRDRLKALPADATRILGIIRGPKKDRPRGWSITPLTDCPKNDPRWSVVVPY